MANYRQSSMDRLASQASQAKPVRQSALASAQIQQNQHKHFRVMSTNNKSSRRALPFPLSIRPVGLLALCVQTRGGTEE